MAGIDGPVIWKIIFFLSLSISLSAGFSCPFFLDMCRLVFYPPSLLPSESLLKKIMRDGGEKKNERMAAAARQAYTD